jgi:hypothetical protein
LPELVVVVVVVLLELQVQPIAEMVETGLL